MSVTILREKILPAAFNQNGMKLVESQLESGQELGEQFQSNIVFVTAVISNNNNNEETKVPIVVKFEPLNKDLWTLLNTPLQFHNELLMYREILPFLEKHDVVKNTFPKFYYGSSNIEDPASDVLLIQDLRPLGYKLTHEKTFIGHSHLSTGVKKLGRFHALSYASKRESPERFSSLTGALKETAWVDTITWAPMISACFHRAIDPVIAEGKHVQVLQKLLSLVDADLLSFMKKLVTPEEPMAVICHGDFCRNNVLYKYNEDDEPVDVMFFDIATARYSSPVVDLAFFIFLNSTKLERDVYLDDWLREYHDALCNTAPEVEVPSWEDVKDEFKQRAIYGFVHCSFFLPMMLYERPSNILDEIKDSENEVMPQVTLGGEEGTRLLSDLITEFVDRGFLTLQHKMFH